ncbi:Uncharacterized protein TPAR_00737 [Tolypocladium paradoxum]|uniref:Uncharacterized protein n=1 Tax=Tolypocladium paradoxum TaxID=94208 RepID=A0A2S4L9G3_9HYPO|nr:Uncharacterized protein TPAR_00737 [Tolypocladium paradoxum]
MADNNTSLYGHNDTIVGLTKSSNHRGTLDILYSTTITILLCVWVSAYPNIPGPKDTKLQRLIDKVNLAMIGALGPDLLFALAVGQWSSATRSVKMFKEIPHCQWTRTHGFYADMGGFRVVSPEFREHGVPVNAQQLFYLVKNGHVDMPTLTAAEIKQMSTADFFSKLIVLWQVFWFIVTQILRFANHGPITTLELTAFTYAVMMLATSVFWFQKPQMALSTKIYTRDERDFDFIRHHARQTTHPDMPEQWYGTPMDFVWKRGSFQGDKHWEYLSHLSHQAYMPLFTRLPGRPWERIPSDIWYPPEAIAVWPGLAVQLPFCCCFLLAWNFHFATDAERIIWRISATYHAGYSLFITGAYLFWLRDVLLGRRRELPPTQSRRPPPLARQLRSTATTDEPAEVELQPTSDSSLPQKAPRFESPKKGSRWSKAAMQAWLDSWRNLSPEQDPDEDVSLRWMGVLFLFTVAYIFSHLFIYVEDLISLRSQPADTYLADNQFFPFIH